MMKKLWTRLRGLPQKIYHTVKNFFKTTSAEDVKHFLFGMKMTDGFVYKLVIHVLLISLGYVYLYPVFYMVITSFMTMSDIVSVSVRWIPSSLNWENYRLVWETIYYPRALRDALYLAFFPALAATFSSALIGYGFAKFRFPFKRTLMVLMILTFIVPPQITMIPTFRLFADYGLIGSLRAFIYPAILGQGLNGAIYILIFYSFFRMIPKSLEESAQLDGASPLQVFTKIAVPLAVPAIIIVFLFSFVWYYNETYLSGIFLGYNPNRAFDDWMLMTLPLRVEQFFTQYATAFPEGSPARELIQSSKMAGNILAILPLLVLYFFTQRHFVESIDKTGITGE